MLPCGNGEGKDIEGSKGDWGGSPATVALGCAKTAQFGDCVLSRVALGNAR